MRTVGVGIDIIEICRVKKIIDRYGNKFLNRHFTTKEIEYCRGKIDSSVCFAGRFTAKEAVYKALNMQWVEGFNWKDIEISSSDTGAPIVILSGKTHEKAHHLGVDKINVSISHCREYAVSVAVATGGKD